MVEWRDRGYVPDSDEEDDDSQLTLPVRKLPVDDDVDSEDELSRDVGPQFNGFRSVQRTFVDNSEPRSRPPSSPVIVSRHDTSTNKLEVPSSSPKFRDPRVYALESSPDEEPPLNQNQSLAFPESPESPESPANNGTGALTNIEALTRLNNLDGELSDTSSSPLSEPPLDLDQDRVFEELATSPQKEATGSQLAGIILPIANGLESSNALSKRSLRLRKVEQLYPYMVEGERYRQSLRASGLKPLRIAEHEHQRSRRGSNSSDVDFQEDKTDSQSLPAAIPPPRASSPEDNSKSLTDFASFRLPERNTDIDGDDDLPDLDAILHGKLDGVVQSGHKRRKTQTYTHKRSKSSTPNQQKSPARIPNEQSEIFGQNVTSVFDFPSSSQSSGATRPTDEELPVQASFRIPRGLSIDPPDTPATSSETRNAPLAEISEDSDSGGEFGQPSRRLTTAIDLRNVPHSPTRLSSGQTDPGSENEDSNQLQKAKKRIKGVLPASWLRLDQQAQKTSRVDSLRRKSRDPPSGENPPRGVAQKFSGRRKSSVTSSREVLGPFLLSSSSEDESDSQTLASTTNTTKQSGFAHPVIDLEDVQEDNRIDRMLPSVPRHPSSGMRRGKKQLKLPDVLNPPVGAGVTGGRASNWSSSTPSKRQKLRHSSKLRKPSTPAPPKLCILDAPSPSSSNQATPNFIKLAARQSRRRKNMGRHSPIRKTIRLHTREDTQDATAVLQEWRRGNIRPKGNESGLSQRPQYRELLAHVSGNELHSPAHPSPTASGDIISAFRNLMNVPGMPIDLKENPPTPKNQKGKLKANVRQTVFRRPTSRKSTKRQEVLQSFLQRHQPRPAQVEWTETDYGQHHPRAAFQQRLAAIDRQFQERAGQDSTKSNLPLERFLEDTADLPDSARNANQQHNSTASVINDMEGNSKPLGADHSRHQRKRVAKHLDINSINFEQTEGSVTVLDDDISETAHSNQYYGGVILKGLGKYGTIQTIDFQMSPLKIGAYFHESTLIGSGDLARVLQTVSSNTGRDSTYTIVQFQGETFRWGPWDESTSSEIGRVLHWIGEDVGCMVERDSVEGFTKEPNATLATNLLRSMVHYFTHTLEFMDPVDQTFFLLRMLSFLWPLSTEVQTASSTVKLQSKTLAQEHLMRIQMLILALTAFLSQTASNTLIELQHRTEAEALLRRSAQGLSKMLMNLGTCAVKRFLEDNRNGAHIDTAARGDIVIVEGWIVTMKIVDQIRPQGVTFWDMVNEELVDVNIDTCSDASVFESIWTSLFALLPLRDVDDSGKVQEGTRLLPAAENWVPIQKILGRLFQLYSSAQSQVSAFNCYLRTSFARCYQLVTQWRWFRCESIVLLMFDFFGRQNGLSHLRNEESHGSPSFLEHLNNNPLLFIEPRDCCFHIFLKIVGAGLQRLRGIYTDRKIRNIAWRLLPNHGRLFSKYETVRQEDLDSLRNHHDLLSVLYWACPPSVRPRPSSIQSLVDPETSHVEACQINIRAWSNLVRFQLSTDESASHLEPFSDWHSEFLRLLLVQHTLARSEGEAHFSAATMKGDHHVTADLLETVISRNQRSIEALLSSALDLMRTAISLARNGECARLLLSKACTIDIFNLFDAKRPQVNRVVFNSLDLVLEYLDAFNTEASGAQQQASEDSQEYGDWAAFEDDAPQPVQQMADYLSPEIYDGLQRLLSNCFGADVPPDESILVKMVDVWTTTACFLVRKNFKTWESYIGSYGSDAWDCLRATEQTRKFGPYFLSMVLEKDTSSYHVHMHFFLSAWISSQVERESMLKFQHRLTTALLNSDRANPLLKSPPFWADPKTGLFSITPIEFRERRLSLISTVLGNMREALGDVVDSPSKMMGLRQQYKVLLRQLMAAMKNNYQELRQETGFSGGYVDFVQHVIEALQQHTADICPVDRFFTDSSAFPLPASDPTYVVGRLKSYGLRLSDAKMPKQLVTFTQTVSERASVDNQQSYLVNQLRLAMSGTFEDGDPARPTLRAFLLQAIFPAYLHLSFQTSAGWILAKPILCAIEYTFDDVLLDLDASNPSSAESVVVFVTSILDTFRHSFELLVDHSGLLEQSSTVSLLTLCFATITAALTPMDYVHRFYYGRAWTSHAIRCIEFFKSFAYFVANLLLGHSDQLVSPYIADFDHSDGSDGYGDDGSFQEVTKRMKKYDDIRRFATHELRQNLAQNWTSHADHYFHLRGNMRKEVVVHVDPLDEEKARLVLEIEHFLVILGRMSGLSISTSGLEVRLETGVGYGGGGSRDGEYDEEEDRPFQGRPARHMMGLGDVLI